MDTCTAAFENGDCARRELEEQRKVNFPPPQSANSRYKISVRFPEAIVSSAAINIPLIHCKWQELACAERSFCFLRSIVVVARSALSRLERESVVIVEKFRLEMLSNLHVSDLPESEEHDFGIMSVWEHDNSKTIRVTGVKFGV
ncbi:hypothetical protein AVEN_208047-1 [Araneus ventricosus]|uniref:Uncharacterized protein n=1 Tax=Araneus ventricosus TaxID=182803 RepID=A0A4Y2F430_ARAVE|nr:hypothetical protein AVEN_208047-1 [Araneus ventricosus]